MLVFGGAGSALEWEMGVEGGTRRSVSDMRCGRGMEGRYSDGVPVDRMAR